MANEDVQFRFGKNARIEIAPYTDGTEPAAGDFINFCLTNQVEVGLTNGTITIDTFCSGGEVEVPDGSQTGELTFGDTTWTEDDDALQLLEDAAFSKVENGTKVHYRIYTAGQGAGQARVARHSERDGRQADHPVQRCDQDGRHTQGPGRARARHGRRSGCVHAGPLSMAHVWRDCWTGATEHRCHQRIPARGRASSTTPSSSRLTSWPGRWC